MLNRATLMAFAPTANPDAAIRFYRDVLGLRLVSDEPFAIVLDANGTMLRIQKVAAFEPLPFTTLGWQVPDIAAAVDQLRQRGVSCERYPGHEQDEHGIWSAPSGARVAWFKDPDGNTLSLTQFP